MLESSHDLERRVENDVDEPNSNPSSWDERFKIVEQKLAEHDGRFNGIDRKLAEHDRRFNGIDRKLAEHDRRFDAIEGHFPDLHAYFAFSFGELRRETKEGLSEVRATVQRLERKLDQLIEAARRG